MPGKKPAQSTTFIAFALDTSGSMHNIREDVRRAYNSMVRTIKEQSKAEGQTTFVAVVTFDDKAEVIVEPTNVMNLKELASYPIRGQTALFDGVGLAVRTIEKVGTDADSYLVKTFTDGGENHSLKFDANDIRRLISDGQDNGNWTYTFQMPPGTGKDFARRFGIPEENVREWEATREGVERVRESVETGMAEYFKARSAGLRSVKNFYRMTTDLSNINEKKLRTKLTDIRHQFKAFTVTSEQPIREFVEQKTRRNYVIGSTFYQLTKKETIQASKNVLIMKKGEQAIYGGREARDLIGLPSDGSDARVEPGNHGSLDIFVESRSVNRLLVRGTRVLVDTTMSSGRAPTWDHTKVKV